eukprot:CAMPEP_0182512256 /NCGR_PEP_ID=MMETSP1321-20130603/31872_1 /TAXON_ID=91990 /ORGANISM="Bolidomonas sp., Strain RCC1657" /LENGTH=54 /DNA_ID=CAMNT_0024719039 /DNA_START=395 /DNA_END=559 /DNA_ORIENTATION=-
MRPSEAQYLVGDVPVEVAVLDLLEVLVFGAVEGGEIEETVLTGGADAAEAVEDC